MTALKIKNCSLILILAVMSLGCFAQGTLPLGINYQAVARDNSGNELVNRSIDVRFSIISGNPLGAPVYQELHSNVITSKYGVF